MLFREEFLDSLATIVEDLPHIRLHYHCMDDPSQDAQGKGIAHDVDHFRATSVGLEQMRMMPKAVGTRAQNIDETVGRVPLADFGFPVVEETKKQKPIQDVGALGDSI